MGRGLWALAAAVAAASLAGMASAARPLETAIFPAPDELASASAIYDRVRATGARKVRLVLEWREVAPKRQTAAFRPENPADPRYRWADFDRRIVEATRAGIQPIVTILAAPDWAAGSAEEGPIWTRRPDPRELGRFARAAALRYSGSFQALPRVRYWLAWNEPNLDLYLNPQLENGKPVAFAWYRRMVNAMGRAVHGVHRSNVVIGGALAPYNNPLGFTRDVFCLDSRLRRKCRTKVEVDIWSTHPYTSGGPTRSAFDPGNVSLGDLPELRAVLRAAERHGMVKAQGPLGFWVTEFGWDTKPPDPGGVPPALHGRWVSEALYRAWKSGVTLVTWFRLWDQPDDNGPFQSGLHYGNDVRKPAFQAFRFPFVALREGGRGVLVWGRVPDSAPADVVVQRKRNERWVRVATLRANRYGIFRRRLALRATKGLLRARLADGEVSRPFNLRTPPDLRVNPFGIR